MTTSLAPSAPWPQALQFLERGWLSSNQIVLSDAEGAIVIDTGYVKHADMTVQLMHQALQGRPLRQVINTHLHSDHCGGNARLHATFACNIVVPQASVADLERGDRLALSWDATAQRCDFFPWHESVAAGDERTLGGQVWRALAAPGHDPKALMWYCPAWKILVSADALWENGFGVIFPELQAASGFAEQAEVLTHIEALGEMQGDDSGGIDWVLPGHGRAFQDWRGAIARARGRLASFRESPRKHLQHALKVLLKFRLMDSERVAIDAFIGELAQAPLLQECAHHLGQPAADLVRSLLDQLCAQGVIERQGDTVCDC